MFDHDTALVVLGAAIALLSSILTATVQHVFTLREDGITRERNRVENELTEIRKSLQLKDQSISELQAMQRIIRRALIESPDLSRDEEFLDKMRTLASQLDQDAKRINPDDIKSPDDENS